MPGRFHGKDVTVVDVFEGVGKHSAGKMPMTPNCAELEKVACPGAGACGGQFTANTMACVAEAIGLALPYSSGPPAEILARDDFALKAGRGGDGAAGEEPAPARHRHPQGVRECRHGGGGHRRLDQCGAASARDGERGGHQVRSVRRGGDLQEDALYRLAQAGRQICRQGHVGSRRRADADAHPAGCRAAAWRLHDRHRQDHGGKSERREIQSRPEGDVSR